MEVEHRLFVLENGHPRGHSLPYDYFRECRLFGDFTDHAFFRGLAQVLALQDGLLRSQAPPCGAKPAISAAERPKPLGVERVRSLQVESSALAPTCSSDASSP